MQQALSTFVTKYFLSGPYCRIRVSDILGVSYGSEALTIMESIVNDGLFRREATLSLCEALADFCIKLSGEYKQKGCLLV
jgi:hypothetical protein